MAHVRSHGSTRCAPPCPVGMDIRARYEVGSMIITSNRALERVVRTLPRRPDGVRRHGPTAAPRRGRRARGPVLPQPESQGVLSLVARTADPSRAPVCLSEAGVSSTERWTRSAEPARDFSRRSLTPFPAGSTQLCPTLRATFPSASEWTRSAEPEVDLTGRSLTGRRRQRMANAHGV